MMDERVATVLARRSQWRATSLGQIAARLPLSLAHQRVKENYNRAQKADDALASILARHRPVPDHGRYSGDADRTCEIMRCDPTHHDDLPPVCAACRDYAGDPTEHPCDDRLDALRGLGIEDEK